MLISRHHDGEINAVAAERLGIGTIRGSGNHGGSFVLKGGVAAFQAMLDALARTVIPWRSQPTSRRSRASPGPASSCSRRRSGRPIYAGRGRHQPPHRARQLGSHRDQSAVQARLPASPREPVSVPADADEAMLEACRRLLEAAPDRGDRGAPMKWSIGRTGEPESCADRLPLALRLYRLAAAAAAPVAPRLLAWRLKRGKEHPVRMRGARGEPSLQRPPGPLDLAAQRERRRIARRHSADRAHPRPRFRRAGHLRHGHVGSARRAKRCRPERCTSSFRSTRRGLSADSSTIGARRSRCSSSRICGPTWSWPAPSTRSR